MSSMTEQSDAASAQAPELPLVSVVILSFNRPALLAKSVASVLAQSYPNLEVVVVDNRSAASDQIAAMLRDEPRIKFVANSENTGFSGGMNHGFAQAHGKYVHFTEDDIEMDPSCVEHLVRYLEMHDDVALASGLTLNPDGTINCAGGSVTLGGVYRTEIFRGGENFDDAERIPPYEVSFVPGAFIMARRDVIESIGGAFNDDFYLYFEDTELCARVLKAGYKIVVLPDARVWHATRPAAPSPDYVAFHRRKNFVAVYLIHASWSVMPEFFARHVVLPGLRAAASNQSQFKVDLAAYRWVLGHLPKLWRERRRVARLGEQPRG